MRVRGGRKNSSACTSGLKEHPSGKAILQNKALQHPVRPTRPDRRDANFVVADVSTWKLLLPPSTKPNGLENNITGDAVSVISALSGSSIISLPNNLSHEQIA